MEGVSWRQPAHERTDMASEKLKIFRRADPAKLEAEVNEWLSALPPRTEIRRSETAITTKNDMPIIVISVWYGEDSD